jgi:hypothetical protein
MRRLHALTALVLFTLRRLFAGKRFVATAILLALPPLLELVILHVARRHGRGPGPTPAELFEGLSIAFATQLTPLLAGLIYGIALSGSEVEDGTAGYVLLGALPRGAVAVGQAVVSALGLAVLLAGSVAATFAVAQASAPGGSVGAADPALVGDFALAGAAALLPYVAVVTACGWLFRWGTAVSIALAILWEGALAAMPVKFAVYAVVNNARGILISLAPDLAGRMDYNVNWDFPGARGAATFIAVVTVVALATAAVAASRRNLARGEGG